MEKGVVFNIQRYSINDGPGIRTCVFLKGCPLNCRWCHNPESKSPKPELSYSAAKCIGCGKCAAVCPNGCHTFADGIHAIDRTSCIACGKCVNACIGALDLFGKMMTVDEVIAEAIKDKPFYAESGGGITFTGGEPFAQPKFLLALLKEAKKQGLHVCIETSGYVQHEILADAMNYVDVFLFDYKETDAERHAEYTGVRNEKILENLCYLAENGKEIVLRCPIIPGYNDRDEHFSAIASLADKYEGITHVDIEPYHPLGKTKAAQIGKEYPLGELEMVNKELSNEWIQTIQAQTKRNVRRG